MTSRYKTIDLNADVGEYSGPASDAREAALIKLISSCSIACGGHAGDDGTMEATLKRAKAANVAIGAHPSYPDREGFGRRSMKIDPNKLHSALKQQIRNLSNIAFELGVTLTHIKAHGALYNDAARDETLAEVVVSAANGHVVFGPPNSALYVVARRVGTPFLAEGFIDRAYDPSGALRPRNAPGAHIENLDERAAQAVAIAARKPIKAGKTEITVTAQTLCIHGDTVDAVETAKAARIALGDKGFSIARPLVLHPSHS